jgi:hypothetical protein
VTTFAPGRQREEQKSYKKIASPVLALSSELLSRSQALAGDLCLYRNASYWGG